MAVHFIAVPPQQQSPSTPVSSVRRSSRHLYTPARTSSSSSSPLMAPSATPSGSQNPGPSPIVTLTPTPASRKRSYHSSSLLDEAEDVDSQPTSPINVRVRYQTNEQLTLIPVLPTPAPTPRAIRAQKRRKLADQVADAAAPAPSLRTSPSLSPLAPQLVFPEPISSTDSTSPYIVETRAGKRKARQFDDDGANSETTSSGSGSDSNAVGDPRPRSLAKRRKVIRVKAPRASVKPATTKLSSKLSTSTTMGRASRSTPRGINASAARQRSQNKNVSAEHAVKHVRRSARLLSNHGIQSLENTAPIESNPDPSSESSMPESIMSPLTPPPDDEESETSLDSSTTPSAVTSTPTSDEQRELTSQVDDQGDEDMEMIASVKVTSTSISAIGCSIATSTTTSLPFKSIIPSHISNPVLKGRLPPNPALYSQVQVAVLARTKPNTPSPLSRYSFTLNTPPSPALSATELDVIDDIAALGPSAVAAFAVNVDNEFGTQGQDTQQYSLHQQVPQYGQQEQQAQFVPDGYAQDQQQQQQAEVYGHQQYPQPTQSQVVSPANPSMLGFMMDMQIQMHLQAQMQLSMAATGGNGMDLQFAVEPMQLMSDSANQMVTESSSTVSMQDVHLPQQQQSSQQGMPATVHIQDAQYAYTGYFSQVQAHQQPQEQYGFDQSKHQQSYVSPDPQPYQHQQEYQHQQFQAQYQQEFQPQEQHQPQDSTGYAPYQAQAYDSSQVFDHQQSNVTYDTIAFHQSTSAPSPSSHYTLGMHNAALYFQQAISRFYETQLIYKKEADEMHVHELHEFQKEREEKKTRLRKTKLASCLPSCSMAEFSAHKAKSLWAVACKARMWEIVKRYSPDLIREVTELKAREYHRRMGFKYPYPRRNYRHRLPNAGLRRELGDPHLPEHNEVGESASLATETGAESDEEEFRKEKIFDFELLDDDEEDGDGAEEEQTVEDYACDDDGDESIMGVIEDEEMDDESDDEDDEEDVTMDQRASEGDPDMEALLDPSYSPELSRHITPLEVQSPSIGSGLVSTFYVPPPELVTMPLQDSTTCAESLAPPQQPGQLEGVHEHPIQLAPTSLRPKILVFHRPVLSLPPPRLSTIQPAALKGYNIDPVLAGRGTPSIRERREPWVEGCLPFTVIRPCAHDGSVSAMSTNVSAAETSTEVASNVDGINVDSFAPCVTTYYAYESDAASASTTDNVSIAEETGSTSTLVGQMVDDTAVSSSSSSVVNAHPVDESAVSVVVPEGTIHSHCGDEHSAHPAGGDDDTEFGDCVGFCCVSEKAKGKRRAVDMDVDEKRKGGEEQMNPADVAGGYFAETVQRAPGKEDHVTSTGFPQGESAANAASEQEQPQHQTQHQTVQMSSEIPDRIPPRRRAVLGRSEILKVYAPLERLLPAMLPLARRPPRPLPLEENPVMRSNNLPYHPVTPYSWEQVADAVDFLAYQGMDARSWVSTYSAPGSNAMLVCNSIVTGADVQPTFNPSSSELSAALG